MAEPWFTILQSVAEKERRPRNSPPGQTFGWRRNARIRIFHTVCATRDFLSTSEPGTAFSQRAARTTQLLAPSWTKHRASNEKNDVDRPHLGIFSPGGWLAGGRSSLTPSVSARSGVVKRIAKKVSSRGPPVGRRLEVPQSYWRSRPSPKSCRSPSMTQKHDGPALPLKRVLVCANADAIIDYSSTNDVRQQRVWVTTPDVDPAGERRDTTRWKFAAASAASGRLRFWLDLGGICVDSPHKLRRRQPTMARDWSHVASNRPNPGRLRPNAGRAT